MTEEAVLGCHFLPSHAPTTAASKDHYNINSVSALSKDMKAKH